MALCHWVRFTWPLTSLPETAPSLDERYRFGEAKPTERDSLLAALTRAYTAEHAWSTELDERLALLTKLVRDRLSDGTADFLALRHGSRIIAASAVIDDPEAPVQLVSGVTVLDEYRCRGLGTYLLYQSLARLKAAGLESAAVVTKKGVTAERYLYGKFRSQREEIDAAAPVGR